MNDTTSRQQPNQQRETSPRRTPGKKAIIVAVVLGLLILAYFAIPHPVKRLHTVDGENSWTGDSAPTQRQIAWQTPSPIEITYADPTGKESLIRPSLIDNGSTLYFTLRKQNGESDIYRSQLVDGSWQAAEPEVRLNSAADDIGAFITSDGQHFYFSSDRKDGGHGGFDLYVSTKADDGWSEPRNLGPQINTPANEYSPTISADGQRLYFSSNRNERMRKRAALIAQNTAAEWDETIRAQQGLVQYDLYVANRSEQDDAWQVAELLAGANFSNSNEGTPFVSTSGVFLYFASDRPNKSGERANYDIYRARLGKTGISGIENLGPGVNTAANEMDPALSLSDFQIVFSSDRDSPKVEQGADDLYVLYASKAVEVYEETEWTESQLAPLAKYWWWALLALLMLALLVATVWSARKVSWRRLPVPTFLLIALLFHLVFATGLFFVGLGGELAEKVKDELEELVGIDFGDDPQEIHPTERPDFDKVTDLKAIEIVQPDDVARKVATISNVPVPTQDISPVLPTVNVEAVPAEQALVLPPKSKVEIRQTPDLTRRRTVDLARAIEQPNVAMEKPIIEEASQRAEVIKAAVEVDRKNSIQQPMLSAAAVKQLPLHSPAPPLSDPDPLASPETPNPSPSESPTDFQLARNRRSVVAAIATEEVLPEKVESNRSVDDKSSLAVVEKVDVDRTGSQPRELALPGAVPSEIGSVARPIGGPNSDELEVGAPLVNDQAVPASFDVKLEIARRPSLKPELDGETAFKPVPTEKVDGTNATDVDDSSKSKGVEVNLARAGTAAVPPRAQSRLTASGTGAPSNVQVNAEPIGRAEPGGDMLALSGSYSGIPNLLRKRAGVSVADDQAETEAVGQATEGNASPPREVVAGVPVGVDRPDADFLKTPVKTESKLGGAHHPRLRRLVLAGQVGERPIEAPLRLASASSGLPRRSRHGASAFYADAGAGLEKMFDLRRSETKIQLVKMFGGNEDSLEAVERGLTWIEQHQFPDGHWSLHEFNKCCKGHRKCGGHGNVKSDVAATGFGLLPFLGFGETHLDGKHQDTIGRGLRWLVENQQSSGELTTGKEGNARMYSHAIGAIALCEAYGLSKDPNLRDSAQRALDFILKAQHKSSGGWRYQPNQSADTSVVGWQLMALKSGQIAGLHVPHESWELVKKWLDQVEGKGKQRGQFRYQPGQGFKLAMTAEGLLCRRYLGANLNDTSIVQGADYLLKHLPKKNKDSSYYWYYATQFMFHLSPEYWDKWNAAQRDLLTGSQIKKGQHLGTWDPRDNWERQGGRLYATSMRVMMLEVYYRHQPLYKLFNQ